MGLEDKLKIKIKKLNEKAIIPEYAKMGDAGLDLVAVSKELINCEGGEFIEYGTGLAIEIPKDHVGLIFPRSSISKVNMMLTNKVGVVDSGYRGEIKIIIYNLSNKQFPIKHGDRIAQGKLSRVYKANFIEVIELDKTERGEGGFGSTGTGI